MNILKDILALDRTKLANQRTLLAYIRTSFYFIGLGLTVIGIESFEKLKFLAIPLFVIAPIVILIGLISYFREQKKMTLLEAKIKSDEVFL